MLYKKQTGCTRNKSGEDTPYRIQVNIKIQKEALEITHTRTQKFVYFSPLSHNSPEKLFFFTIISDRLCWVAM